MENKVLRPFVDRESGAYFAIGSLFSSSNLDRTNELGEKGFLQVEGKDIKPKVEDSLLAEAKDLKIKGYTKMTEENLRKAIEAVKAKKASEADGQ
ncbi:MAG: hypothetical protein ABS944_16310 [Solibacillus sp.]|uniref:hypothetical protein n=1 Tax=Solibacillus sp. TaxID=1909654 RepID=UPI0033151C3A